jgi:hypothetical protein
MRENGSEDGLDVGLVSVAIMRRVDPVIELMSIVTAFHGTRSRSETQQSQK